MWILIVINSQVGYAPRTFSGVVDDGRYAVRTLPGSSVLGSAFELWPLERLTGVPTRERGNETLSCVRGN